MLLGEKQSGRTFSRQTLNHYYLALHDELEREVSKGPEEFDAPELRQKVAQMEHILVGTPKGEQRIGMAVEIADRLDKNKEFFS